MVRYEKGLKAQLRKLRLQFDREYAAVNYAESALSQLSIKTKCRLNLSEDGDETGFVVFGRTYAYICVVRRGGQNFLEIRKGAIDGDADETLCQSQPYDDNFVTFQMSARYEDKNKLTYRFTFGGSAFTHKFYADKGVWTGAR